MMWTRKRQAHDVDPLTISSHGLRRSDPGEEELMSDSYYDVAQICENGHVANSIAHDNPARNQDHCDKCGSPTIMACPSCQTAIRGFYHASVPSIFDKYVTPAFCYKCGKPFPWTDAALRAAVELADEFDGLTDGERGTLKKSLPELVLETPRTRVAETRFKKIMWKVGKEGCEAMRSILTDFISETVRKTIFSP